MDSNGQADEGLRQRKRRETRSTLSRAAIRLCIQRGWANVTVDEIAASANVSPRTFRNYFSTKAEAVAAGHLERMLRIADELRVRPAREPLWTAIINSIATQFEPPPARKDEKSPDVKRWMELIRLFRSEPAVQGEMLKATAAAQGEFAKSIAERTGTSGDELYPQVVAAVVSSVVSVVMERWLRNGPSCSIVPLMREAFDLVAASLPVNRAVTGR